MVERGLAAHTLEAYRRDLQRYAGALAARGTTAIGEVTTADVAAFLAGLREGDAEHQPLAASSAGRAVVAVRGLHAFAAAERLAGSDPARLVRPPAPPRRLPRAISVPEVERLLAATGAAAVPAGGGGPAGSGGSGGAGGAGPGGDPGLAARPRPARAAVRHRGPDIRGRGPGRG